MRMERRVLFRSAHGLKQQETKPAVSSPAPLLPFGLSSRHGLTLPEMVADTMMSMGLLGPGEIPSRADAAFGLRTLESIVAQPPSWYKGPRLVPPSRWHDVRHALARELCPYFRMYAHRLEFTNE